MARTHPLQAKQEAKKEGFVDKLKFWEETRPRQEDYDLQLQVRTKASHAKWWFRRQS